MIELEPLTRINAAPPRSGPSLIVVAASAGGLEPMLGLLAALPPELDASVVVALLRTPNEPYRLDRVIQRRTQWPVSVATEGDPLQRGIIYVVPHDRHLLISPARRFERAGAESDHLQSSAGLLLASGASAYGDHLVAAILAGAGTDATDALPFVHAAGGHVYVQDPHGASLGELPIPAIAADAVDDVLEAEEIATTICTMTARR